jgi:hypothetical protein
VAEGTPTLQAVENRRASSEIAPSGLTTTDGT